MKKTRRYINPSAKLPGPRLSPRSGRAGRINYFKIVKDVNAIIARGAGNMRQMYQRQVLTTNWEVSQYLNEELPLDDTPTANNGRIVRRLSKEFKRPDRYFYGLIRFYKLYPKLPGNNFLSWTHYEVLLKVSDAAKRKKYAQMAIQKRIPSKILYGVIMKDRGAGMIEHLPEYKAGAPLPLIRGKLYHYKVMAPAEGEPNTGIATLDVGFKVYRDIAISKKSTMRVGHTVRTIQSEKSDEIFSAKLQDKNNDRLYTYAAKIERVVDGDTLIALIDLGLKTKTRQRLRLRGINTPELTTTKGKYVKGYVRTLLSKVKFVIVKTYKDDKYGRMLGDVFVGVSPAKTPQASPSETRGRRGVTSKKDMTDPASVAAKGMFLNQHLIDEGLAELF